MAVNTNSYPYHRTVRANATGTDFTFETGKHSGRSVADIAGCTPAPKGCLLDAKTVRQSRCMSHTVQPWVLAA